MRVMKSQPGRPTAIDELAPGVIAAIAKAQTETVDFEAIRAAMPAAKRAELTDGVIHQICLDAGLMVER